MPIPVDQHGQSARGTLTGRRDRVIRKLEISIRQLKGKGGEDSVAEVRLSEHESLESALRRFKRKVQQEDIIKEVKRHAFYVPPGEKRRVKSALARKRSRKQYRRSAD